MSSTLKTNIYRLFLFSFELCALVFVFLESDGHQNFTAFSFIFLSFQLMLHFSFDRFCVSPSRLVPLLPQWPERGLEPLSQCLRASTSKTRTHGFFVALLEKHSEALSSTPPLTNQNRWALKCWIWICVLDTDYFNYFNVKWCISCRFSVLYQFH